MTDFSGNGIEAMTLGLYNQPTGTMIDGVVEFDQQKHWDAIERDIDAQMDDDSGEDNWLSDAEDHYLNSFGE